MASTELPMLPLYQEYKQLTKYVLEWLGMACRGDNEQSKDQFATTLEIITAARKVSEMELEVPLSIIKALQDVVKKRRLVYRMYQGLAPGTTDRINSQNGRDDQKHMAFIERLEQVLQILTPLKTKLHTSTSTVQLARSLVPTPNHFTVISLPDTESTENAIQKSPVSAPDAEVEEQRPRAEQRELFLEDDDLGEWVELTLLLREIDAICSQVNTFWKRAAKRDMPLPLAACLTNTALFYIERRFAACEHIAHDVDTVMAKWMKHMQKGCRIRFTEVEGLGLDTNGRIADGLALYSAARVLQDCRTIEEYQTINPEAGRRHDPLEIFRKPFLSTDSVSDFNHDDDQALNRMQESMRQLNTSHRAMAALEISEAEQHISEPLLPLLARATAEPKHPLPFHLVVGMEMLLCTYKAFIWPDAESNSTNCRLLALKFAKEVQRAASATAMAIHQACDNNDRVLRGHEFLLTLRAKKLNEFICERCFDLYYQSPWTAGSHMVEILTTATWEGLQLCRETGYLCAVLHLYNAVRQLDPDFAEVTLLEKLQEMFFRQYFLGSLPTENFSSQYRRAMGSGIDKSKARMLGNLPVLNTADPANAKPIAASELSLFYALHHASYKTGIDFWCRVYHGRAATQSSTQQQKQTIQERLNSTTFNIPLAAIGSAVLGEFSGDTPFMRINFFAVFQTCLALLQQILDVFKANNSGVIIKGHDAGARFAIVDLVLEEITAQLEDPAKRALLKYWRPLGLVKQVFRSMDGTTDLSSHSWSI